MPILDDELQQHKAGHFGYSAVKMDDLGASEYTLVTIVQDVSSSVASFKRDMEKALAEIIHACQTSPRVDNLLVRLIEFSNGGHLNEIHGFKMLSECSAGDYDNCLNVGGMTALFDATVNGLEAIEDYGRQLRDNDFDVNGIVFIITDGCDNDSKLTPKHVMNAIETMRRSEHLDSIISVLIGVGMSDPQISSILDKFSQDAKLDKFISLPDASWKTLAKLAEFISKSISAQSSAIGSGQSAPIQSLTI